MMDFYGDDIKEKTITLANGKRFRFLCRARDTLHGFAHDVQMLDMDDYRVDFETSIYYLNRTWESYRFQSAICDCIRKALFCKKYQVESAVKKANGWLRITSSRRHAIDEAIANDAECKTFSDLLREVNSNNPKWD